MSQQPLPLLRELVLCPKQARLTGDKWPKEAGVDSVCVAPAQPSLCTQCCLLCGERSAPSIIQGERAPEGFTQTLHREPVPSLLDVRLCFSLMPAGSPSNLGALGRCSSQTTPQEKGALPSLLHAHLEPVLNPMTCTRDRSLASLWPSPQAQSGCLHNTSTKTA